MVAARDEFLEWLMEIPPAGRADIDARLRSTREHAHFSARLELFVHHYFHSNGWNVQIHPTMAHSPNHPDFLVDKHDGPILVECRSVFDQEEISQQDQRIRQVAESVSRRLGRTVILQPLSDLPPNVPARRIRSWIEQQDISDDSADRREFDFWDDHEGQHYGVRAILPKLNHPEEPLTGVHGLISQAHTITNAQRLRAALLEKASKYGQMDVPYVIAISCETRISTRLKHEVDALFGNRVWNVSRSSPINVTETRNPNGIFTLRQDGAFKCTQVSAVLFYRFKWLDEGHIHGMHIYHNPYADKVIETGVFPGIAQCSRQGETAIGWFNGEPE